MYCFLLIYSYTPSSNFAYIAIHTYIYDFLLLCELEQEIDKTGLRKNRAIIILFYLRCMKNCFCMGIDFNKH